MCKIFTSVLIFITIASYGQLQIQDTTLKQGLETVTGKMSNTSPQGIVNNSFIAADGEKFLRFEIIVNTSIEETWNIIATEEGIKKWMAPVVTLDLRMGGMLKTNYDATAKIEDMGTIKLGIINYIPSEIISYKITLNALFAEKCRKEDKNLQHIIQLKSLGDNKTKIISTMAGWGQGTEWDEAYIFFERGNEWTFQKLLNVLSK